MTIKLEKYGDGKNSVLINEDQKLYFDGERLCAVKSDTTLYLPYGEISDELAFVIKRENEDMDIEVLDLDEFSELSPTIEISEVEGVCERCGADLKGENECPECGYYN